MLRRFSFDFDGVFSGEGEYSFVLIFSYINYKE